LLLTRRGALRAAQRGAARVRAVARCVYERQSDYFAALIRFFVMALLLIILHAADARLMAARG